MSPTLTSDDAATLTLNDRQHTLTTRANLVYWQDRQVDDD